MDAVLDNLDVFLEGFTTTVSLTLLAAVGALVLGTLIAAMRVSPVPPLRWVGAAYVNLVRNTPLTVVFFLVVFGLPEVDILLPFYRFAVIALSVYTAAFVCEAIRSGINTVPVGQAEAARAVGMTFFQVLTIIVLPQAGRAVVAPLGSIFIALAKNSTIVGTIGLMEASSVMKDLLNRHGDEVIAIFLVFAGTFAAVLIPTCYFFGWLTNRLALKR